MFRKELALVAIVLGIGVYSLQAAQIASTWDGGGDGHSWGNADNWDPNIVPDNNDFLTFAVTIDSNSIGVDEIEVGFLESRTIDQLDCNGIVSLAKWTPSWIQLSLNDSNGLTNYGDLTIEFDIIGNLTNTAGARLDFAEHLNIYGNLYNSAGGIIDVFGEDMDIEDANIINDGLIRAYLHGGLGEAIGFRNSGRIELFDGSHHGGIFDNNSTGFIEGFGVISSYQLTQNKGIIYASHGALLLHSDGSIVNTGSLGNRSLATLHILTSADVNNQGIIEVNAGGGVAFDCNLVNEPNGIIELLGGTLALNNSTITQKADANFAGFGGISGDVVIDPNGLIQLTGPTNVVGDVTISPNATLEVSDGLTLITGHTTCNGTIRMLGGYIIPQGGLSGSCNVIWEPGLYTNVADFNLDGHVNLEDFALFADTWLWQSNWH